MSVTEATLTKHARRFGSEGVMEAALDAQLPFEEMVRLQTVLDEIDSQQRGYRKPRLTAETRVKRLLGIEEEKDAA